MLVSLSLRNTVADRRIIPIDCPACRKQNVAAQAQDLRQTLLLFHLLPVFHHRPTLVTCHACGAEFVASLKTGDLERVGDPQHVARYLRVRLPLVLRALVLGGIVAWLLPLIGMVWTGIAYWWSRRYTGWVRWMALVPFLFSLLPTLGLVLAEAWTDEPPTAASAVPTTPPPRGTH